MPRARARRGQTDPAGLSVARPRSRIVTSARMRSWSSPGGKKAAWSPSSSKEAPGVCPSGKPARHWARAGSRSETCDSTGSARTEGRASAPRRSPSCGPPMRPPRWGWPRPPSRPPCATRSSARPSACPSASIRPYSSSSPTWPRGSPQAGSVHAVPVGHELQHGPGRALTDAYCRWFALLTMNQHPLHADAHYAETHTQHKQRVVMGPLVFSMVIGMSVADISGRAIANLEVNALKHEKPTFIGDTLYAQSRVLELHESRQGDRGVVTVETTGLNQRGEQVCSYTRKVLVPKRNHSTLGLGKLPY